MANMDSEKYSLRQRQKRKRNTNNSSLDSQGYASDNSTESFNNLRDNLPLSRTSKRPHLMGNEGGGGGGGVTGKSKSKAAPLSKYRRKTANARERTRMREINTAFETLRTCVPPCITNEDSGSTNEKLTKITTLRLAMKYIGILTEALAHPNEADNDFLYDCTKPRPVQHVMAEENFEPIVEVTKEKKSKSAKNKTTKSAKPPANNPARKSAATNTKRLAKKTKSTNTENVYQQNTSIPAAYQESPASNASSAYASLSSASESSASPISNSSYVFEQNLPQHNFTYSQPPHHNSMSDLSNLMLESDGESLNLSERCGSPLQAMKKTSNNEEPYECSPTVMPTLENPLEMSLRLMEPAADTLGLSVDPIISPSSCISPLMNLEPFTGFDLFHTEFSEPSALDLFLT